MYTIEKEEETLSDKTDPVFEIVRRRGGAVYDPHVGKDSAHDPCLNSKRPDFLEWVFKLGLEEQLRVYIKEEYPF
jgi:hypothetical protein